MRYAMFVLPVVLCACHAPMGVAPLDAGTDGSGSADSDGGGSVGTDGGGSGTDGGSIVVGDCTNLGPAGTWTNITPPVDDVDAGYLPAAFDVDEVAGIVYLGTSSFNDGHSKGVQRSADCGATWEHVSTGTGSDAINGGRQWTFAVNPVDRNIIYTNSGDYASRGLWKSVNGGVDWTDVTPTVDGPPGDVGNLQMDPNDPDHLLLTWHDPCYGVHGEFTYSDQVGCFHESTDGGLTWKGHYGTPSWPAQVRALLLHGSTWVVLGNNTLYTSDGGNTYTVVVTESLGGHTSGTLSRASNGVYFIGTQFGAYRSSPGSDGKDWTMVGGQWVGDIADTGSLLYEMQVVNGVPIQSSADGVSWSDVAGSPTDCEFSHYDRPHKVLYVGCGGNGFWRLTLD